MFPTDSSIFEMFGDDSVFMIWLLVLLVVVLPVLLLIMAIEAFFEREHGRASFFVFLATPEYKVYHLFYILLLPFWLVEAVGLGIAFVFTRLGKIFTVRLFKRPDSFKQALDKYDRHLLGRLEGESE